jgi:hypothetical protein
VSTARCWATRRATAEPRQASPEPILSADGNEEHGSRLEIGLLRALEEITAYVDGFEFIEPDVAHTPLWRPETPFAGELSLGGAGLARMP